MAAINIMLAAIALQVSQPMPATTPADNDILVVARRLKKMRWKFETKNGALSHCTVKRISGSALLDGLVCEA